MMLCR